MQKLFKFTHKHKHMAFKTITIKESAYRKIKAAKRQKESFSEFFERTVAAKQDIKEFSGTLSDEEADEALAKIRRERERATKEEQDALSRL